MNIARAIEESGWEEVDIAEMYIVMAEAAISFVRNELQMPTEAMNTAALSVTTQRAADLWTAMFAASAVALVPLPKASRL